MVFQVRQALLLPNLIRYRVCPVLTDQIDRLIRKVVFPYQSAIPAGGMREFVFTNDANFYRRAQ